MRKSLGEKISVISYFDAKTKTARPHQLVWQYKNYQLGPVDFHHKTRDGDTMLHHFSVCDRDEKIYFKLLFNSNNLHWELEEVMTAEDRSLLYGGQGY
ncbi:MAG: hypothetical protein AAF413_03625 [Patescibacteria group bacterium]